MNIDEEVSWEVLAEIWKEKKRKVEKEVRVESDMYAEQEDDGQQPQANYTHLEEVGREKAPQNCQESTSPEYVEREERIQKLRQISHGLRTILVAEEEDENGVKHTLRQAWSEPNVTKIMGRIDDSAELPFSKKFHDAIYVREYFYHMLVEIVLQLELHDKKIADGTEYTPIGIFVYGTKGIGKSSFLAWMIPKLHHIYEKVRRDGMEYLFCAAHETKEEMKPKYIRLENAATVMDDFPNLTKNSLDRHLTMKEKPEMSIVEQENTICFCDGRVHEVINQEGPLIVVVSEGFASDERKKQTQHQHTKLYFTPPSRKEVQLILGAGSTAKQEKLGVVYDMIGPVMQVAKQQHNQEDVVESLAEDADVEARKLDIQLIHRMMTSDTQKMAKGNVTSLFLHLHVVAYYIQGKRTIQWHKTTRVPTTFLRGVIAKRFKEIIDNAGEQMVTTLRSLKMTKSTYGFLYEWEIDGLIGPVMSGIEATKKYK